MAMLECDLHGSLFEISEAIDRAVNKSVSASVEDESYCEKGNCACSVKGYERYSYIGGNRVSLSVTLFACGEDVHLTAISSGGSQAVFFKINTWGEEAFLEQVERAVHNYERRNIR